MIKSSEILKLGIAALIVSMVCLVPAMADVTPIYSNFNFVGTQIGSIAYTLIPDKSTYRAGDVISYIFQMVLTSCDPTTFFDVDHILDLGITLDPHITNIKSNADYWLTGGGDGMSGNSGFFYDFGLSLAWGFGFPPMTYLLSNDDWPWGSPLQVSGVISPGTPPGTKIKTSSFVDINVNDENTHSLENQYTSAGDTNVVTTAAPEFPSPALPAAMILGLLGTVFVVRRGKQDKIPV
jgi:hypothetical protein